MSIVPSLAFVLGLGLLLPAGFGRGSAEAADAKSPYRARTLTYTSGAAKDRSFAYRLMVPAALETKSAPAGKTWPLILFLHGAGERGSDNEAQLKYFPTELASSENRSKFPAFVLAPQCPAERAWSARDLRTLLDSQAAPEPVDEARAVLLMLEEVRKEFPVDPDRIYLTGLSMGGFGSWYLAALRPELWAAVVPICGGGDPRTADRIRDLAIWAFHGSKDTVVLPSLSRDMIEAVRAAGGSPRYTEFPEAGHDSWTAGYGHPDFLPWLFAAKRAERLPEARSLIRLDAASALEGKRAESGAGPIVWKGVGDAISWVIDRPEAADLDVTLVYACPKGSGGSVVEVACGEAKTTAKLFETKGETDFVALPMGLVRAPKGVSEIVLRAVSKPEGAPEIARVSALFLEREFVSLFDGKTLAGWEGDVQGYKSDDGMISCLPGGNLYTAKEYSDFVFRFEFRLEPGSNNGIGVRTPRGCDAAYCGMEIQVLDDGHEMYKGIQPWQAHGSIYHAVAAKRGCLRPTGEWNVEEIRAVGPFMTITLNGTVIVDADLTPYRALGTIHGADMKGLRNDRGYLGFLGHGSRVDFRAIRIRDLAKR